MRTRWGVACICYLVCLGSDSPSASPGQPKRLSLHDSMNAKVGSETVVSGLRTLSSFTLFGCGQLRAQFFVLALVTHHFESAFGFFVSSRDFRLYLGGSLFHLW
jgi:hypothetical protein